MLDPIDFVYVSVSVIQVILGIATTVFYWAAPDRLADPIRASWQVVAVVPTKVFADSPDIEQRVNAELALLTTGISDGSTDPVVAVAGSLAET